MHARSCHRVQCRCAGLAQHGPGLHRAAPDPQPTLSSSCLAQLRRKALRPEFCIATSGEAGKGRCKNEMHSLQPAGIIQRQQPGLGGGRRRQRRQASLPAASAPASAPDALGGCSLPQARCWPPLLPRWRASGWPAPPHAAGTPKPQLVDSARGSERAACCRRCCLRPGPGEGRAAEAWWGAGSGGLCA